MERVSALKGSDNSSECFGRREDFEYDKCKSDHITRQDGWYKFDGKMCHCIA